jgi:prophage regulatory protein
MNSDKVVRRKQLLELIGVSSVTQWRLERAGLFPQRFRLGLGGVGWHLTEVEEWLRSRERVERQRVERKTLRRAADRAAHGDGQAIVSGRDVTIIMEGKSEPVTPEARGASGEGTLFPGGEPASYAVNTRSDALRGPDK